MDHTQQQNNNPFYSDLDIEGQFSSIFNHQNASTYDDEIQFEFFGTMQEQPKEQNQIIENYCNENEQPSICDNIDDNQCLSNYFYNPAQIDQQQLQQSFIQYPQMNYRPQAQQVNSFMQNEQSNFNQQPTQLNQEISEKESSTYNVQQVEKKKNSKNAATKNCARDFFNQCIQKKHFKQFSDLFEMHKINQDKYAKFCIENFKSKSKKKESTTFNLSNFKKVINIKPNEHFFYESEFLKILMINSFHINLSKINLKNFDSQTREYQINKLFELIHLIKLQ